MEEGTQGMSRTNPRIDAQLEVLRQLADLDFSQAVKSYTGEFIDNRWLPKFHYYQGVEHFRQQIRQQIEKLEAERTEWLKHHVTGNDLVVEGNQSQDEPLKSAPVAPSNLKEEG